MRHELNPVLTLVAALAAGCIATGSDTNESPCVPAACGAAGVACGPGVDDGCGGTLDCGCEEGRVCADGVCKCPEPPSCASIRGIRCGLVQNDCGETLDCGVDCPLGTGCGADSNLCGTPCDVAADCPGLAGCEQERGLCAMTPACFGRCGSFVILRADGVGIDFVCPCPDGSVCDESMARCGDCDAERQSLSACAGRCGEVVLCDERRLACASCPSGVCDDAAGRCRLGARPSDWGEPWWLGLPPELEDVRAVAVVVEGGEIHLLLMRQGADGKRSLHRAVPSPDRRTLLSVSVGPTAETPAELNYGFDSAPTLSADGSELFVGVSNHPSWYGAYRYRRRADDTFEPVGRIGPASDAIRTITRLWDDATFFAAGPTFLEVLRRDPTQGAEAPIRLVSGAFDLVLADDPEGLPRELTGLQAGCDGLSLTFQWMEGDVRPGSYGVIELTDPTPAAAGRPQAHPLPSMAPGPFPSAQISEVPGCSGIFFVDSGRLFYAPAP